MGHGATARATRGGSLAGKGMIDPTTDRTGGRQNDDREDGLGSLSRLVMSMRNEGYAGLWK